MPIKVQGLCPLIQVYDMPLSVAFYTKVLGFELEQHSARYATRDDIELFHWCLLRVGNSQLMLNTAYEERERPAQRDAARQAWHSDTTIFFDCHDLDAAYEHLQAHGVECPPPATTYYGMRQLSFHDPDGYNIVLHHPVGAVN